MNKSVLVIGVSGSGKSFICDKMIKLGYTAYDLEDINGMFNMVNKSTHKTISEKEWEDNKHDLEYVKQHDSLCNIKKLQELIDRNINKDILDGVVLYFGTASNTDEILSLFNKVILLKTSSDTIRKRLDVRTSNDFGRASKVQNWLFEWKDWWEDHIQEKGAMTIDANHDVEEIIRDILSAIKA